MGTRLGETQEPQDKAAIQAVADMADALGAGQYASRLCPSCEGGRTRERTMSMEVQTNGIVKFFCNRASCDFKGSVFLGHAARPTSAEEQTAKPSTIRPLTSPISPLSEREIEWFKHRFGIDTKNRVYRAESRYALPIYTPLGVTRGYNTRSPYKGSPADTDINRNDSQYPVKALIYIEVENAPVQSWYGLSKKSKRVVLVEDQISAIRLSDKRPDLAVVALLGTGVNTSKLLEVQQTKIQDIVIALDADATGQAFAIARKYGPGFRTMKVEILPCDIKDMTEEQLEAAIV